MVYLHNGNTRKKTTSGQVDEIVIEYVYDNWNQLIQYIDTDGTSTDYTYNGNGERTAKSNNGVTTKYYWDRGYVSNETTGTTFTATNYIGAQGVFARTAQNATNYMFKNGHGDVVSLVNNGTVTQTYDYEHAIIGTSDENFVKSRVSELVPFLFCQRASTIHFDIVNNSWHIFLKHSHTYAAISNES